MNLEAQISKLLQSTLVSLTQMIEDDVRERIGMVLGQALGSGGHRGRAASKIGARGVKGANIRPCKIPNCGKPSKGPRFRFLCEDHRSLPQAKIDQLLNGGSASAPKSGARKARGAGRKKNASRTGKAQAQKADGAGQ